MTGVTSTPLRYPSKSICLRDTIVRNVLPVPLSPARQMALGSSSRPQYFAIIGCRSTWSLKESMRMLNSLSRPMRFAGENFSGGYSLSNRSWIFLNLLGETRALLHLEYDLSTDLRGITKSRRNHGCLSHQGLTDPNRNSESWSSFDATLTLDAKAQSSMIGFRSKIRSRPSRVRETRGPKAATKKIEKKSTSDTKVKFTKKRY